MIVLHDLEIEKIPTHVIISVNTAQPPISSSWRIKFIFPLDYPFPDKLPNLNFYPLEVGKWVEITHICSILDKIFANLCINFIPNNSDLIS